MESGPLHVVVLCGHAVVLDHASLLEKLALRCEQPGSMSWLHYFLNVSSFKGKKPYLVLMMRSETVSSPPQLDEVEAAVLLFEYRAFGLPTGVFSTDDWAGFRSVVAPEAERASVAAAAADAMLQRGAQFVLVSYRAHETLTRANQPALLHAMRCGWRTRPIYMSLPLEPRLEATLAKLGRATRFNLGYYRRRLVAQIPHEFLADVRGVLKDEELDELNRLSLNPISPSDFRLQVKSALELNGGYVLGLRTPDGKWLSLVGGWRQRDVTVMHWQMNASGYEKFSLGTAMRSFFLEHEIGRGTKTLMYYGGTRHSMANSFVQEEVTDLLVQRGSLRSVVFQKLAGMLVASQYGSRINSVVVQAIGARSIEWQSPGSGARESVMQVPDV
jgi:hypothetical protein